MKTLESLDSLHLEDSQSLAKSKRKSVVNATNIHMDKADDLIRRINNLKAKVFIS